MAWKARRQFIVSFITIFAVLLASEVAKFWANTHAVDYRPVLFLIALGLLFIFSAMVWQHLKGTARWWLVAVYAVVSAMFVLSEIVK